MITMTCLHNLYFSTKTPNLLHKIPHSTKKYRYNLLHTGSLYLPKRPALDINWLQTGHQIFLHNAYISSPSHCVIRYMLLDAAILIRAMGCDPPAMLSSP